MKPCAAPLPRSKAAHKIKLTFQTAEKYYFAYATRLPQKSPHAVAHHHKTMPSTAFPPALHAARRSPSAQQHHPSTQNLQNPFAQILTTSAQILSLYPACSKCLHFRAAGIGIAPRLH
jgi:hypothetical protein